MVNIINGWPIFPSSQMQENVNECSLAGIHSEPPSKPVPGVPKGPSPGLMGGWVGVFGFLALVYSLPVTLLFPF